MYFTLQHYAPAMPSNNGYYTATKWISSSIRACGMPFPSLDFWYRLNPRPVPNCYQFQWIPRIVAFAHIDCASNDHQKLSSTLSEIPTTIDFFSFGSSPTDANLFLLTLPCGDRVDIRSMVVFRYSVNDHRSQIWVSQAVGTTEPVSSGIWMPPIYLTKQLSRSNVLKL